MVNAPNGEDFKGFNITCPFCGARSLCAVVPLFGVGYMAADGDLAGDEVALIMCFDCERDVPADHYFEHANKPCDCEERPQRKEEV